MLQEIFTYFLYVAGDIYLLFICRERGLRVFLTCRGKVDSRASSGKFLRLNSRYPESFRFLCLCKQPEQIISRLKTLVLDKACVAKDLNQIMYWIQQFRNISREETFKMKLKTLQEINFYPSVKLYLRVVALAMVSSSQLSAIDQSLIFYNSSEGSNLSS